MKFMKELVEAYAKKIYQFAYSRTQNVYDAEDLAQDIVLALCRIVFRPSVENMVPTSIGLPVCLGKVAAREAAGAGQCWQRGAGMAERRQRYGGRFHHR